MTLKEVRRLRGRYRAANAERAVAAKRSRKAAGHWWLRESKGLNE